jgi:Winged helix DNA-binding domain
MMRATQHLVTAADYRSLRLVLQPLLARVQRNVFGRRTEDVDLTAVVADARRMLAGAVRSRPELARLLVADRPGADRAALAWSVQYLLPIVHPAPSGTWDAVGTTPLALAEEHLGGSLDAPDPQQMVRRYLAAFGPAAVADIRAWSGVSGLQEIVAGMRQELQTFRDESGRELLDLPDAPRPDPETPAPVRLLAAFDNLLLGYADRIRVMTDEVCRRVCVGDLVDSSLLVDGMVSATWELDRDAGVLTVRPFARLAGPDVDAIVAEGARLVGLAAVGAAHPDVRVLPPT